MIGIIILASGFSRRMGEPKLLLPWNRETILRTVVKTALNTENTRIKVIVNGSIPEMMNQIQDLPVDVIKNEFADQGISSSITKGIKSLEENIKAALILLADQPMITPKIINDVIHEYERTKSMIVQAAYFGTPSHPVLFDRILFPNLLTLTGDKGAKTVIEHYREQRHLVNFAIPPLIDIDTKEEYLKLVNTLKGKGTSNRLE